MSKTIIKTYLSLYLIFNLFFAGCSNNKSDSIKKETLSESIPLAKQTNISENSLLNKIKEKLIGKTVILKRLDKKYIKDYWEKMNYPEVLLPNNFPAKVSLEYIKNHLLYEIENMENGGTLNYTIWDKKNNELIGGIDIRELSPDEDELDSSGQFGCWLTPKYWGKGKCQEAFKLITKEYFRLYPEKKEFIAHVKKSNLRSFYALKKCGFKYKKSIITNSGDKRYILVYEKTKK